MIVPGKGIGGEAKVLRVSDRLYRTDLEVLKSIKFPGNAGELSSYLRVQVYSFFPSSFRSPVQCMDLSQRNARARFLQDINTASYVICIRK